MILIDELKFVKEELYNLNISYTIEECNKNLNNNVITIRTNTYTKFFIIYDILMNNDEYYKDVYNRLNTFFGIDLRKVIKDKILKSNFKLLDEL